QVLASAALERAASGRLTARRLPALSLKGLAEPVAVLDVKEPGRRSSIRPRAPEPASEAHMVGRADAKAMIEAALAQARGDRCRLVAITGEAGIGKSRLLAWALDRARALGLGLSEGACDTIDRQTPYAAWRGAWLTLLGIDEHAADGDKARAIAAR